jgi:hypothetical protein
MVKKQNKYLYGYKLYINYGQGWEYELFEESLKEIKQRAKEYRENAPQYPRKITSGRELNPNYKGR